jgi:hypothetical protein
MKKGRISVFWNLCRSFIMILILTCVLIGLTESPAAANGIPVQVFLDHLPFKTTWTPASGSRGVAVVSANDEQVRVMAQDLPEPPAGQVYYAWLEKVEGGFLAIGALDYHNDGTASLNQVVKDLPYSENFSWVLVSVEDSAQIGSTPGSEVALAGRLPNAMALPHREDQVPSLLPVTGEDKLIGALTPGRWIVLGLLSIGLAVTVGGRRQLFILSRFFRQQARISRGNHQ